VKPIFADGSIRGMNGYGMAAYGAKRTFAKTAKSAKLQE
jgi:hypothetical protein